MTPDRSDCFVSPHATDPSAYRSLAQQYMAEPYEPSGTAPLRRRLTRAIRLLRRTGIHAAEDWLPGSVSEWLRDNFSLLMREGYEVRTALRQARPVPTRQKLPALVWLFWQWMRVGGPLDQERLHAMLTETHRHRPLTVAEWDQLTLYLRGACLLLAADACREPEEPARQHMAAAIGGLRYAAALDKEELIARHGLVEHILREDPAGQYAQMDDETRADYRRRVARLAQVWQRSEASTAGKLLELSQEAPPAFRHIGFALQQEQRRQPFQTDPGHGRGRLFLLLWAIVPALLSLLIAIAADRPWLCLLIWLPLAEGCRPLLHWLCLRRLPPRHVPRMRSDGSIPEQGRTVITVSTLLPSADKTEHMAKRLYDLYNTNGRGAVQICLLADLPPADDARHPQDDDAIRAMRREILRLNRQYDNRFVLAVRKRTYSRTMRTYIGAERKRGAIGELIRVIRGAAPDFAAFEGDLDTLRASRYLLALDADTGLLMDTAATLVATAMHPLMQAYQPAGQARVTRGYGIFMARLTVDLPSANRTPFSRAMTGAGGITPYDLPTSDWYMDSFGRTVFTGKGLIDIAAFAQADAAAPFPTERILSHDILEGALLRTALVSDVEMTDGFPATMHGWLSRLHRWIRGDWQNFPFVWRRRLPLRPLDRFQLTDNVRRAVTPAACLLCLLVSPRLPGAVGTAAALIGLLAPLTGYLLSALLALIHSGWLSFSRHYYSRLLPQALHALTQALYTTALLPATACVGIDATARALTRLCSGRRLLEWTTAAQSDAQSLSVGVVIRLLAPSAASAAWLFLFGGCTARLAGCLYLLLIPLYWLSRRSAPTSSVRLTDPQRRTVTAYAAAAWSYYETHCTVQEHYLPPDNVQETPVWRIAHRTSPTNIGLYLLCIVAACDLGLIDREGMLLRLDRTLSTVEQLETWQGHLLNWYDTRTLRPLSPRYVSTVDSGNFACCLVTVRMALKELATPEADALADRVHALRQAIRMEQLYDATRRLFPIGLDPDTGKRSPSYYDLLMSESRLTGYYAIATRAVPKKHWGALSRSMAQAGREIGPVSWSGTFFEYFLPRLFFTAEEGSMEYEALRFCLRCQRRYPPRGVPWGISESGFYAFDSHLNYQYKAHGVPRLALKRGQQNDLVISPYSSFLALTTLPDAALRNLRRLERDGMTGDHGFYEAADYTPGRTSHKGYSLVRSYMAHHVGMSLLSCANACTDDAFVHRFLRDPDMARATELLYEQAPAVGPVSDRLRERRLVLPTDRPPHTREEFRTVDPLHPRVHLLSGHEWQLIATDTGVGVSMTRGMDIHRFSRDTRQTPQGIFAFVDDPDGAFSLTAAPVYTDTATVERYTEFQDSAVIWGAETPAVHAAMRAVVHPRLAAEQRQVLVKNQTSRPRSGAVVFYFEPSLAVRRDAEAHPAFSRLFLTTRYDAAHRALLVRRHRRGEEPPLCLAVGLLREEPFTCETVRARLLCRPDGIAALPHRLSAVCRPPEEVAAGVPDGAVAVRVTFTLPPHTSRIVSLVLTAASSEEGALTQLTALRREGLLAPSRAASGPFGGVEAQLAPLVTPDLLFVPRPTREWIRAARENTDGLSALWALGISGDDPLMLMHVYNAADASRAEPYMRMLRALRRGGVACELIITYREGGAYDAPLLQALRRSAAATDTEPLWEERGGIHLINLERYPEGTQRLLTAFAAHLADRDQYRPLPLPADRTILPVASALPRPTPPPADAWRLPVGYAHRDTFALTHTPSRPWCHVLANPTFGTLVSDRSLGYTWAINAHQNKLTPWSNDPLTEHRGERLLCRLDGQLYDAVNGASVTYSRRGARYAGQCGRLHTAVTVQVPARGMWKQITVVLDNMTDTAAEATLAYYAEPVLGADDRLSRLTVARWEDGCLLLHNPAAPVSGTLWLTATGADGCVCDRPSFWAGRWDQHTLLPLPHPCAALPVHRRIAPHSRETVTFWLGFASDDTAALRSRAAAAAPPPDEASPWHFPVLHTPDDAVNVLAGHWLPWQTMACRTFARTGFYQCGGAWGFRDQLQDSLALLWIDPTLTRRQLLRCAAVQFPEGDVLHWWHALPHSLRGVRTRCADDRLWLPFVLAAYVDFTGDRAVLEVPLPWLEGEPLAPEETDRYAEFVRTADRAPLYEHAVRAIDVSLTAGAHNLPLIGSGDWNDGFNLLGVKGKGESVWLALFSSMVLTRFIPLCESRCDHDRAARYREAAQDYRHAADATFAQDRYARAYADNGTALGVAGAPACALDSLTQSFAQLAGLPSDHTSAALTAACRLLTDTEHDVVKLFTPAFHGDYTAGNTTTPIGYLTAYPPGIRENGGQYTHAAVWLAIALLDAGRADEGWALLERLNPLALYRDGKGDRYGGEPYVLAGDVSAHPDLPGQAGWTWYTGAAGWAYTAIWRYGFGLRPHGDWLEIRPCFPTSWHTVSASLTVGTTALQIRFHADVYNRLCLDGQPVPRIPLDGASHTVDVFFPSAQ